MTDPDDLEDLLKPQTGSPAPALRDELLRRTERVLTRARWLRLGAKAAAVAAVFLVGGAVGWLARPERERVVEVAGAERIVPIVVPLFLTQGADSGGSLSVPESPLSATAAELQAEQADDRAEAAKLYRVAGDTFLGEQDYANATRCYRLFLTRAGDDGLSPERGDSWLLTSLKNAAFQEKTDVPKIRD
jgi:hypothetical protein